MGEEQKLKELIRKLMDEYSLQLSDFNDLHSFFKILVQKGIITDDEYKSLEKNFVHKEDKIY